MLVNGKHYRTVWFDGTVKMIDQNKLPFSFEIVELSSYQETAEAIKNMTVRGAGAIGATAGFGMAQASGDERARDVLKNTRPTAQNLFYAVDRVFNSENPKDEAQKIADEDCEACKKIGENGEKLIEDGFRVLTHCNAGWLAFVDWGSALSPIYAAKRSGKNVFVFADETRPRGQGARLTAWELKNEEIPHSIIADNAAGYYMKNGEIDLVIVGADRIAANGDVANKIGTLEKAILAKEFGIPFYVAAPTSTIDINTESGNDIPIEERSEDEVLYQTGPTNDNRMETIRVASPGSKAKNPAFDVTPAKYVRGIITEKGIIKADKESIKKLLNSQ